MSTKPGQLLSNPASDPPVVRVVCRYPFDAPKAWPRWVVEHINAPTHKVEIINERDLYGYDVLVTAPLQVALDGSEAGEEAI